MGGIGSGRYWRFNSKSLTNNYLQIDIRRWHKQKLLIPNQKFTTSWSQQNEMVSAISVETNTDQIVLSYTIRDENNNKQKLKYGIKLSWLACHFGGLRPWFHCPAQKCGRRVAILYGGTYFICRTCLKLAYPSQLENLGDRATRKADKIRERLQWDPGIFNGEGLKPKGMHWKTFERLRSEHNALVDLSLEEARRQFGVNMFDYF
jgi:hypothetical protein